MTQDSLFDLAGARSARDEAMGRVEGHADPVWKEAATETLMEVVRSLAEFTSDDLWALGLPKPREPRALGPIMMRAVKNGYIKDSGRMKQSAQKGCHARPMRVWLSLICET